MILSKLFNSSLRLGSLVIKLGLTLYMGRFLGLSDLGTYGLVASYVAIAIPLLGMRFDYVVSRDIVDSSPFDLGRKMRDQAVFYGISYVAFAFFIFTVMFLSFKRLDPNIALFTLSLCILESFATITSGNFTSIKRPILANILFFMRAALWVFPVIALGIINPGYRTAETIFTWWLAGVSLSLFVTGFVWRTLPWKDIIKTPIDWVWIRKGVKNCFFIWLGAVGGAASIYIDRFVVEWNMGREFVGIASFYGSFTIAISALLTSGIFAFGYPHLISLHREGKTDFFYKEAWKMAFQAMLSAGILCLVIGVSVPVLGQFFERPEFSEHALVLWLMLFGVWLKSISESLYYVLYARHQDRAIWLGNILLLIIAFFSNALLMPSLGFISIGYSSIISSIFLCLWRLYWTKSFLPNLQNPRENSP